MISGTNRDSVAGEAVLGDENCIPYPFDNGTKSDGQQGTDKFLGGNVVHLVLLGWTTKPAGCVGCSASTRMLNDLVWARFEPGLDPMRAGGSAGERWVHVPQLQLISCTALGTLAANCNMVDQSWHSVITEIRSGGPKQNQLLVLLEVCT